MLNWNTFDTEFKNKKYSKFLSNELNFFLYFKDKEYFEEFVKPGIASRMEKTLIDYEKFDEFKHISVYDSLNALEQCLLIAVVNMSDNESAKMLAEQFIHKAKLVKCKTAKKYSEFDTVLLMKILESDEVEEDSDDGETTGIKSDKKKMKKKGKQKVIRQRSMSMSSDDSYEGFNWAARNKNESDYDDSYGEGDYDYDDGEGDYGEKDYEDEYDQNIEDDMYELQNENFEVQEAINANYISRDDFSDRFSSPDLDISSENINKMFCNFQIGR